MSDDDLDRDFGPEGDLFVGPLPYSPHAEMLRIIDRMLDLMDRIIEQNGVTS